MSPSLTPLDCVLFLVMATGAGAMVGAIGSWPGGTICGAIAFVLALRYVRRMNMEKR